MHYRTICLVMMGLCLSVWVGISAGQDADPTEAPDPLEAGSERVDSFGIAQVWVPAGCFMMGTTDAQAEIAAALDAPSWAGTRIRTEQPAHEVCLTEGFWLDQFEVTNAAFQAFVDADGYTTPEYWSAEGQRWLRRQDAATLPRHCENDDQPDHPRACITWYEAEAYATWRGASLPTEAQWEYAARGADALIYPWGNEWDTTRANVEGSEGTTAVGAYPEGKSWVNAYDMAGNVMEWVRDWLDDGYYATSERDNPEGPARGLRKVERGGWWGSNSVVARSAYRHFEDPPTYQDHHIGFRVVSPGSADA